jgi:hypothetical protein
METGRTVYAIDYLDAESNQWVKWHVYDRPLDADRAFERIRALRPARPIRLVRKLMLASE